MLEELTADDGRKKQTKSKSNQELLDLQDQIQAANQVISKLKRENVELKVQVKFKAYLHFWICWNFFTNPASQVYH